MFKIKLYVIIALLLVFSSAAVALSTQNQSQKMSEQEKLNENLAKFINQYLTSQNNAVLENKIASIAEKIYKDKFSIEKEYLEFTQWILVGVASLTTFIVTIVGILSTISVKMATKEQQKIEKTIKEAEQELKILKDDITNLKIEANESIKKEIRNTLYLEIYNIGVNLLGENRLEKENDNQNILDEVTIKTALNYFQFLKNHSFNLIHVCRHIAICNRYLKQYEISIKVLDEAIDFAKEDKPIMVDILKEEKREIEALKRLNDIDEAS